MEERLDRLFKDKLANNKIAPSANAWEQIHGQLKNKKQNTWTKRLAIAATLLLFASASFIGYNYINGLKQDAPLVSSSLDTETNENSDPQNIAPKNSEEHNSVTEQKTESSDNSTEANDGDSKIILAEVATESGEETSLLEPVQLPEITAQEKLATLSEAVPLQDVEQKLEPELMDSENTLHQGIEEMEEPVMVAEATLKPQKSYPKVSIIYKADANSDLVASNNRNLLDKGIKKITKFSDEHIVTDQVKTKLRNTKDDLLALNFGKILNKSNRDVDN